MLSSPDNDPSRRLKKKQAAIHMTSGHRPRQQRLMGVCGWAKVSGPDCASRRSSHRRCSEKYSVKLGICSRAWSGQLVDLRGWLCLHKRRSHDGELQEVPPSVRNDCACHEWHPHVSLHPRRIGRRVRGQGPNLSVSIASERDTEARIQGYLTSVAQPLTT